mmetsp:Transcript_3447/g.8622  ORF Transcript_3447/g.8622 Transcript_3447/m.8622 type:complete len:246 (-) Transcript_3447:1280-2017(-)
MHAATAAEGARPHHEGPEGCALCDAAVTECDHRPVVVPRGFDLLLVVARAGGDLRGERGRLGLREDEDVLVLPARDAGDDVPRVPVLVDHLGGVLEVHLHLLRGVRLPLTHDDHRGQLRLLGEGTARDVEVLLPLLLDPVDWNHARDAVRLLVVRLVRLEFGYNDAPANRVAREGSHVIALVPVLLDEPLEVLEGSLVRERLLRVLVVGVEESGVDGSVEADVFDPEPLLPELVHLVEQVLVGGV